MAINAMPAIDVKSCGEWTENDLNLYQHLDHYLDKTQADRKKWYPTFDKVLNKKRKWKQSNGPTMRLARSNPSPDLRQFFFPKPICIEEPRTDVMNVTESFVDAQVYRHRFESPHFSFCPDFRDFMSHIDDNGKDIMEKIDLANEKFIRGMMFHMSPWVLVAQNDGTVALVPAPSWPGTGTFVESTMGKNAAFLNGLFQAGVADITGTVVKPTGRLRVTAIEQAMTIAENDLGVPFFSGSDLPKEDQPLDGKFLIVMDSEAWNQLIYDPFVQGNRPLDFDIVTNGYRGSFFGRATTRLEARPLRYHADGTYSAPELRVTNSGQWNDQDTEPNPDYTRIAAANVVNCSPFGVAWLIGKNGYEGLEVGPPPEKFTGNSFPNAPAMSWNGEVRLTKNFLLSCLDANGNVVQTANTYGNYIKFISEATYGIVGPVRRNAIPIIYQRQRGPATPA